MATEARILNPPLFGPKHASSEAYRVGQLVKWCGQGSSKPVVFGAELLLDDILDQEYLAYLAYEDASTAGAVPAAVPSGRLGDRQTRISLGEPQPPVTIDKEKFFLCWSLTLSCSRNTQEGDDKEKACKIAVNAGVKTELSFEHNVRKVEYQCQQLKFRKTDFKLSADPERQKLLDELGVHKTERNVNYVYQVERLLVHSSSTSASAKVGAAGHETELSGTAATEVASSVKPFVYAISSASRSRRTLPASGRLWP